MKQSTKNQSVQKQPRWIILNQIRNSYSDLIITYYNIKTKSRMESTFGEGEHHHAETFLVELNKG